MNRRCTARILREIYIADEPRPLGRRFRKPGCRREERMIADLKPYLGDEGFRPAMAGGGAGPLGGSKTRKALVGATRIE